MKPREGEKETPKKPDGPKNPHVTEVLYYEDTYNFKGDAQILDVSEGRSSGEFTVTLDKTIFHPQGGGQPSDKGTISFENSVFTVTDLKHQD